MVFSIARLRVWLGVGAALLILVIAGFLGYARYRTHRFLAGLPGKLGIDIRRETNGYTFSKSVGPHTTMTLHAAKAVEHKDGKLTLHDVSMVLYGRKQDRADRISGAEFEYDQQTGVVRAMGEVQIDLQAPAHGQPTGAASPAGREDRSIVHVKTSGLVFLQRLGVAATDQELEFRFGAMTGRAHGAEYNSDTGIIILQSAVEAHGEERGAPVTLLASHAELDRPRLLATATDARYTSPTQTARGDRAVVHLRSDNSPERIEADGNVVLTAATGGFVATPHADLLLTPRGQAESAHLFGGVAFTDKANLREVASQANDARIAFDAKGKAHTVLMTGKVDVKEQVRTAAGAAWTHREATAARMNFALDAGVLRTVDATEAARLTLHDASGTSELTGDTVHGNFTGSGKTAQLIDLHATGHTGLHRLLSDGAEQTSTGDTLAILTKTASPAAKDNPEQAIRQATQAGHVVFLSKSASEHGKTAGTTRATAETAVYEGASDHVTLTGGAASGDATIVDDTARIAANRIVLDRPTGDATADGAIKATYLQPGASEGQAKEPIHVIADRADLQHAAQRATFHGLGRSARLWQGGSQVEAPVLELDQKQHTLNAHGDRTDSKATPVHAVLASTPSSGQTKSPQIVRVTSRTLVYRDADRQADFAGDVLVEDADGTARVNQATVFLQPAGSKNSPTPNSLSLGGGVERIVAKGHVELDQPGRRATGEELVYTAANSLFVLTGTPAVRPRLMDETQGTVTGQSLSFHSGDKTVVVTGGAGERVQTITRVKQR